jgi:transposase
MQTVTTIGLDIAKSVFQVHGVDAAGQVVIRRQLKRRQVLAFFQRLPACLVGIETCASSHHSVFDPHRTIVVVQIVAHFTCRPS